MSNFIESESGVYAEEENLKVAIIIRASRAALGLNQEQLAENLGVPKSTIARMESLEIQPKVDVYMRALRFFKESGIDVDIFSPEITIRITPRPQSKKGAARLSMAEDYARLRDEIEASSREK